MRQANWLNFQIYFEYKIDDRENKDKGMDSFSPIMFKDFGVPECSPVDKPHKVHDPREKK